MVFLFGAKTGGKITKKECHSIHPIFPFSPVPHASTPLVPSSLFSLDHFHLLITRVSPTLLLFIIGTTVTRRCQLRHMFHIVLSKSVAQKSLFIPAISLISLSSVPRMCISFHAAEVCVWSECKNAFWLEGACRTLTSYRYFICFIINPPSVAICRML